MDVRTNAAATAPHSTTWRLSTPTTTSATAQARRTGKTFGLVMANHSAASTRTPARVHDGCRVNRMIATRARTPLDTETDSESMFASQAVTWAVQETSSRMKAMTRRAEGFSMPLATVTASAAHATIDSATWARRIPRSEGHSAIQMVTPQGRME